SVVDQRFVHALGLLERLDLQLAEELPLKPEHLVKLLRGMRQEWREQDLQVVDGLHRRIDRRRRSLLILFHHAKPGRDIKILVDLPREAHRLLKRPAQDRKSTRLNSSHVKNSYA